MLTALAPKPCPTRCKQCVFVGMMYIEALVSVRRGTEVARSGCEERFVMTEKTRFKEKVMSLDTHHPNSSVRGVFMRMW